MIAQSTHANPKRGFGGSGAPARRKAQRGAASLIVVMVLFFIMSLVAAYTSRNLIFEQRTSVNQYRSTQAQEAAEAGLEWALAQLNGARIDAVCTEAGAAAADTSFRQRYLGINTSPPPDPTSGMITVLTQAVAGTPPRRAGCVWTGVAWSCSCPSNGNPALAAPAGGTGVYPAFWVSFSTLDVARPGVVQIVATGCTRPDATCLGSTANSTNVEGRALMTAVVALKSAITTPPVAALTVLGDSNVGVAAGVITTLINSDPSRGGITLQAGGVITTARFALTSSPGTPGTASVVASDASLSGLLAILPDDLKPPTLVPGFVPNDRAFAFTFGAWPNSFRLQPGAVRLDCLAGGCGAALATAVTMNPDRVIWINGGLTVEAGVIVGTSVNPAVIVVAGSGAGVPGNVSLGAGAVINGVVYSRGSGPGPGPGPVITWAGTGMVRGAAFVEGNFTATSSHTIVFDGAVVDNLRLRAGSFVRVPGGWRDFP